MAQQVVEPPVLGGTRRKMSYEEWRAWDYEGRKSEWVAGKAIVFMPTTVRHFRLMRFLLTLLDQYVRFRRLGEVFAETIEMHLGDRGRLPDVLFVRADQLRRVDRRRLDGPADLAVELVSDDSVDRDYEVKFAEYAAAGVAEYWIIDSREDVPDPRPPAFYHLVDGACRPLPLDPDGRLWSRTIRGFWLRPEWLGQDPLPDPLLCLDEIAPEALDMRRRRAAAAEATPGIVPTE